MAKKPSKTGAADLPEELLDRSIGVLEGPVNAVLERVLKSRLFLWPVGLTQAIAWKAMGKIMGAVRPSSSSSSSSAAGN
ncbi:MAG: hypothetical protein Q8O67_07455 [Deltaproteobacteria bacterium]|nr:hypothetical protein [Deltaproteobacteria bacterium]